MNITQLIHINTNKHIKIIVPYAVPNDNNVIYRAWYDQYRLEYNPTNRQITLYDNEGRQRLPIAYLNDHYRNRLVAVFEKPGATFDDDNTINERPFVRLEIAQHNLTNHLDLQGPLFIVAELYEPEL